MIFLICMILIIVTLLMTTMDINPKWIFVPMSAFITVIIFTLITVIEYDNELIEINDFEMVKTQNRVMVDVGTEYIVSNKAKIFSRDKDEIEVYLSKSLNVFGNEIERNRKILLSVKKDDS